MFRMLSLFPYICSGSDVDVVVEPINGERTSATMRRVDALFRSVALDANDFTVAQRHEQQVSGDVDGDACKRAVSDIALFTNSGDTDSDQTLIGGMPRLTRTDVRATGTCQAMM